MSRIVATSDLHGYLPKIPECDILLISGDLCPHSNSDLQQMWLNTVFKNWLEEVPAKDIVGIAGNHDFIFQNKPHLVPELPWHYLQDESKTVQGFQIYGTPWQPYFYDWAFNLYESDLAKKFNQIPENTDILVCHGPPHGFGDLVPRRLTVANEEECPGSDHVGSPSLRNRIFEVKPKLVVFGHIHEGFGVWEQDGVTLANVSLVNARYNPVHEPMVFDI